MKTKKGLYVFFAFLLIAQLGIFIYGCGQTKQSSGPTGSMSSTSALSVVVKDAATGSIVPMSSVFVSKSSVTPSSRLHTSSSSDWVEVKATDMGIADVSDLKTDASTMLKVVKDGYKEYDKVVDAGKSITGYTIEIVKTTEATATPKDTAFDPTSSGGSSTLYACSSVSTCMSCGCNPDSSIACGGACGCTDSSTSCKGGKCKTSAAGGAGTSSFGKCTDAGCPTGCKNCGACACTSAGGCGGSSNCPIKTYTGGGGSSESSGACADSFCPTGCKGCGSCVCTSAGGCGGSSFCTGGSKAPDFSSGGGGCTDAGCPPGCRACGSCVCTTAGNCGGSSNCTSGGGSGGGGGGGGGIGCYGSGCPASCATSPCGACSCTTSIGAPCSSKGGSSYCTGR
ncbi:MAG: hypothetical protein NTZ10_01215 [Candidatus Saganbacteria bacterium]|nr:hypothetical protein [Candidatus Saganbacteria bacterium]